MNGARILEATITAADEYGHVTRKEDGSGELHQPVVVEVAGDARPRSAGRKQLGGKPKVALSITQHHQNVIGQEVCHRDVHDAVAVEVCHRDALLQLGCAQVRAQRVGWFGCGRSRVLILGVTWKRRPHDSKQNREKDNRSVASIFSQVSRDCLSVPSHGDELLSIEFVFYTNSVLVAGCCSDLLGALTLERAPSPGK